MLTMTPATGSRDVTRAFEKIQGGFGTELVDAALIAWSFGRKCKATDPRFRSKSPARGHIEQVQTCVERVWWLQGHLQSSGHRRYGPAVALERGPGCRGQAPATADPYVHLAVFPAVP